MSSARQPTRHAVTGPVGPTGPACRRGFTLIEILVSVALIGGLAGGMFAFFVDLTRTRDRIAASARESADAALAFDRIEADLWCAIAGAEGLGAGVSGDAARLSVLTRSVSIGAAGVADLQRCEYSFAGGGLAASRAAVSRRAASGAAASETLVEGLDLVRFRYFDGREWVESFDSLERGALPVAVEAAMWFASRGRAKIGEDAAPVSPGEAEALPEEWTPEDQGGPEDFGGGERLREPDRLRVLIVPDGPVAAWREAP